MASDAKKILLVEDEKAIRDAVAAYLEREGYWVVGVGDGQSAIEEFEKHQFDLVVLDLMLPKIPGERVCRTIRDTSDVPIIMLTAREEEVDKVLGLELGADDYMTKPFSLRELMARLKANLRRNQIANQPDNENEIMKFDDLTIDTEKYEVKKRGEVVPLTFREFELLKFLATRQGKIFSRQQLLNKVWDYEFYGDVRTVDVTIRRLREKIEDNPSMPVYIITKRGVGYYFGA